MNKAATVDSSTLDDEVYGGVYDRSVVVRMARYILPHKALVATSILAMLVFSATQVAVPWIIKIAIDDYIMAGDFTGLTWVVAVFIGNAIFNWGALYAMEISLIRVGQRILYQLRGEMFSHLQKLSLTFFDKTNVGRIMSRVQGDVYQLQEFLSVVVVTLGDFLVLIWIVAALLLMNVKLGLISMAVLPLLVLVMMVWQPHARRSFLRVRRAISIVNGALNENITGVRVVQSMNRQEHNLEAFDVKNHENYKASLVASRLSASLLPPVDMLTALAIGLAIFFGAGMVSDNTLEVGALIAFVLYIQRFFDPIRGLTMQYTQLQRAMASGVRIFELLETEPDLVDSPGAKELPRLRGEVELKGVSYGYIPGLDVLKNVSFHIEPGETVAIVGPTGAGKTTLVSLLSRFYDVPRHRGAILVDGHDIRDETRKSLVTQMSMVLQEPFLFTGTVTENIKYSHTEATDTQMIEAARAVGAHDFIMGLENGYDTYLHERGVNLSMGQRQLVSFARAIVADPRILILDEATANIDSYTELLIQRALKKLLKGRTAIVIAHRLSTIRGADKIVVLDQGEVVEVGTHQQLMDRGGLYEHLYQMNFAALKEALPVPENGDGQ
jgi:ATP-binding cassette subfamily B protein